MTLNLEQLHKFHDYICSLDYYADFEEELYVPEVEEKKANDERGSELKEIPLTFDSVEAYKSTWEKLFFLEAKAQIKKAEKEEKESMEEFRLIGIDKPGGDTKIFIFAPSRTSGVAYLNSDIVLMSSNSPEQFQEQYALGMIHFSTPFELKIKTILNANAKIKEASPNSIWYVTKLCNIATLNREYQALHSIGELNLKEIIVNPKDAILNPPQYFDIPDNLDNELHKRYNKSQYVAIKESLKKEGITLVQGPPGTGKTTTILGVLSVLLNSKNKIEKYNIIPELKVEKSDQELNELQKKRLWRKAMPWLNDDYENWQEERDHFNTSAPYKDRRVLLPEMQEETAVKPSKILICAPSNAAIDEIIRKMMDQGLIDANNKSYMPDIVRIGPNYHKSVQEFSLEYLQNRELEARTDKDIEVIRNDILKKAKIICSTLSVTGSNLLTSFYQRFDTVIIDEAGQAVEISTLIPLKYDCKRLILIGDPKQLPATVFSRLGHFKNYDRSLFSRLQLCGYQVHMLDTQYRMHPQISQFVSESFYDSKLLNSENIMDLVGSPSFYTLPGFAPVTFFNVKGKEEFVGMTFKNEIEAKFVTSVYNYLSKNIPNFDKSKFGIITPYNGQAEFIRKCIAENDATINCTVEVNSVDGFQGREKDIIIISTVRSRYPGWKKDKAPTIGFVRDDKRMNVSLSRARVGLIIVGDIARFFKTKNSGKWKPLINHCIGEKRCFDVSNNFADENYFDKFQKDSSQFLVKEMQKKKPVPLEGTEVEKTNSMDIESK